MNWIKANKFLAGFFGVMLVSAGVLGFLLFSAKARHDEVSEQYESQAAELNRLLAAKPYPDAKNLELIAAQKGEHLKAIAQLQQNLTGAEIAVEPLSPQQFQDRLRESVSRVTEQAAAAGMALPEKFFMGFDRYQTEPPRPEAAPVLGRDLKAIEFAVSQLIKNRATALTRLDRGAIEEEGGTPAPSANAPKGTRGPRDNAPTLLKKHPFALTFVADHIRFVSALNNIVGSKTQFFIPRLVQVKNQQEKGPARVDPTMASVSFGATPPAPGAPADPTMPTSLATPPTGAAAPAAPGAAPAAPAENLKYIVGEEKIEATLNLEIIDFAEPATAK
jgi:hypothetical protein